MKSVKMMAFALMLLLVASQTALAGNYGWMRDLNIHAQADPSGFRAMLGSRFKIGDLQVRTVLSNVDYPADAYMTLRLGEMSGRPMHYVMDQYRSCKKRGWGVLAKSLGIKPGSQEFHDLKRGHDLYEGYHSSHSKGGSRDHDYINYDDSGGGKGENGHKNKKNGKGKKT